MEVYNLDRGLLNPLGNSLLLNGKDWLFFGYKGNWVRMLLAQHWRQQSRKGRIGY